MSIEGTRHTCVECGWPRVWIVADTAKPGESYLRPRPGRMTSRSKWLKASSGWHPASMDDRAAKWRKILYL